MSFWSVLKEWFLGDEEENERIMRKYDRKEQVTEFPNEHYQIMERETPAFYEQSEDRER